MSAVRERWPQMNVRVRAEDLATIRKIAAKHHLPMAEYVRRTALGEALNPRGTLEEHEQRLQRLEQTIYGT